MKTQIITIATVIFTALGVSNFTYAAAPKANSSSFTILTGISAINKIEVHGNVELYVSDGETDQVKVYNKYYSESALVQSKHGVLCITSYKAEKLVVWVTANDLRAISAYDNAEVKSFGDLSKIEFEVDLFNNASAKLNIDAYSAKVTVNDGAKANLSGNANEYELKYNNIANVNEAGLKAIHATKTLSTIAKAVQKSEFDDLANL